MLKDISRRTLVGFWFATVALIIAFANAMGVSVAASTMAVLLTLCLVPPGILLFVWRGAPPPTVAEILYAANSRNGNRP